METYFVTSSGVTVICHSKDSVLGWVEWIINKGGVPTIEKHLEAA